MSRRALVSLCRTRQGARAGARASWIFAFLVAGIGVALLALLRQRNPDSIVQETGRWLAWATAPFLLGIASAPALRDRQEGIESMVRVHGGRRGELALARALAAMVGVTWRILLPGLVLAASAASLAGPRVFAMHGAVLAMFACTAGVLLGGVASVCGEAAGARGRELLVAAVLVPWVLADVVGAPAWSIPGLLDAGLALLLEVLA